MRGDYKIYWLSIVVFVSKVTPLDIIMAYDIACTNDNTYVYPLFIWFISNVKIFYVKWCHD